MTISGFFIHLTHLLTQSAGAVEYTDCISAERYESSECPEYDTKQSDGEVSVMELWGMWSIPSLPSLPGPINGSNRTKLGTYAKLNYLK